jgi:hypothetical protein
VTSNPPNNPAPPPAISTEIRDLRKELLRLSLLAIPTALVQFLVKRFQDGLAWQPWQSVWILIPLIVVAWILWQIIKGRREFRLHGPFLAFFVCYVLVFDVAASSGLLDWKRVPVGYDPHAVPSSFLIPGFFGDWRYRFLQKNTPDQDVSVVLMPPAQNVAERRADFLRLIRLAQTNRAKGLVFDFYFPDASPAPLLDELLCREVKDAAEKGTPSIFGYSFDVVLHEEIRRQPTSKTLPCIVPEISGHAVVLEDVDDSVRYVPLYFRGDRAQPSLSLRAAGAISNKKTNELSTPENSLLQFTGTSSFPGAIDFEELTTKADTASFLRDQWVFVGEKSEQDTFKTPFGKAPGVIIHAFATESLVHNRYIQHLPPWQIFVLIFGFCYLLTVFVAQGVAVRGLLQFVSAATLSLIVLAAVSMWFWRVWVDTIYFASAIWILLPLLLAWRKLRPPPA